MALVLLILFSLVVGLITMVSEFLIKGFAAAAGFYLARRLFDKRK